MTQPSVTQHIHHLEHFYGVKLFAYDGRQLLRTKEAEQLKRYIDSTRRRSMISAPGLCRRTYCICGSARPRPSVNS